MSKFNGKDLEWVFVLFGTSIGAGILFLPIQAAISGIIPLIIVSVMIVPIIYTAEKNIGKILLDEEKDYSILQIFDLKFNKPLAVISNIIYFLTCFTVIIAYAVSLPHELGNALVVYKVTGSNLSQVPWFSFLVLFIPIAIMITSRKLMLKLMSILIYPLIICLLIISCSLIPYWDLGNLDIKSINAKSIFIGFLMVFPILVFSMNFSQAISQMSIYYKLNTKNISEVKNKINKNIFLGTIAISFFTLFFIYSCILAVDSASIAEAAQKNISAVSVISSKFKIGFIHYLGPIIAVAAILSSFLGVFLGTLESFNEGLRQLIGVIKPGAHKKLSRHHLNIASSLIIFVILWPIAVFNLKIILILGTLTAPCIATLIFLLPAIYRIYTTREINFRKNLSTYILVFIGFLTIFGYAAGIYLLKH